MEMTAISNHTNPDPPDMDAMTDEMLYRDNMTWSKGFLRRRKILSMIVGNKQPSRKKIFSEIRTSEDLKVQNIEVQGKSIRCAKIFNPALLIKSEANSSWKELTGVQRLEIEDAEGVLREVPKQLITELTNLESFSMTWTNIRALPSGLFQLPLNSLYLQRNQLKSINGIERAGLLTILDVSNNSLDSLPKTFGQLSNLVTLNLSGNSLRELPDSIGAFSRLKTLDCSCNRLKSLPDSINNLIELTSLDVCNNQLAGLPETIGFLPKLEDLRVRSNLLQSLPDAFGQLIRLNSLLLRNNRFEEVPQQLSQLTNLQSLNMRDNSIRRMEKPIASLKYLILDYNDMTEIDDGIIHCSNLQLLSLQFNKLVDIKEDVCRLQSLRSLHLSGNHITNIPPALSSLIHLRHLNMRSTKITTVPQEVAEMENLSTLELDDCMDLEPFLKIEYRNKGLAGIREYLKPEKEEKSYEVSKKTTPSPPPRPSIENRARP